MSRSIKRWIGALAVAVSAATLSGGAGADGEKVSLTVTSVGYRNTTGQAIVALFDKQDGWPKLDKALRVEKVKLKESSLAVTFRDLPTGTYAVEVIHDENENGKLDMRWLPFPKPIEGAGASNDAQATVGPPSWSDARFKLGEKGGNIKINIRYW